MGGNKCANSHDWQHDHGVGKDYHISVSTCAGKVNRRLIPLFMGGIFDADFNGAEDRRPVSFATPEDTERAYIEAVITGDLLCCSPQSSMKHQVPCLL